MHVAHQARRGVRGLRWQPPNDLPLLDALLAAHGIAEGVLLEMMPA